MSLNSSTNTSKRRSSLGPTSTVLAPLGMGLSLTTQIRVYWPSAAPRASRISTITRPRSRAEHSGIFDTPNGKCPPPPGGSSGCVTDSLAFSLDLDLDISSSPPTMFSDVPTKYSQSPTLPITPGSTPNSSTDSLPLIKFAPFSTGSGRFNANVFKQLAPASLPATPPLTPDNTPGSGIAALSARHNNDALDFLQQLFPHDALKALPFAKSVKISSASLGAVWDGVILELPSPKSSESKKTLYVNGKGAEHVQLRESIVALLDLADERFGCSAFVIALERASPALGDLLHSLMYVSGTIVTTPPFPLGPSFVLVGIEM